MYDDAHKLEIKNMIDATITEVRSMTNALMPSTLKDFGIGLLTSIDRMQINYSENNSSFLPGYLPTPGFIGTMKPTFGYTMGSQRDVRHIAAQNGWLTTFDQFNQQYSETHNENLDYSINTEPISDLKIDFTGGKTYATNFTENFNTTDTNGDGLSNTYNSLIQNTFGNFNISTSLIRTAFSKSDANQSATFDDFRDNRLIVANRLARDFYGNTTFPLDAEGFPVGFGKNSQRVLLPSFLAAYHGTDPEKVSTGAFRDIPIPNWQLKYTGLMKLPWFKKNFKRFSVQHGYTSSYTVNQFNTNLLFDRNTDQDAATAQRDQAGNFLNNTL